MADKNENKKDDCSRIPYMWPMGYNTYGMPVDGNMWQGYPMMNQCAWQNYPMRCPMCGNFITMGNCMPYTNTSFPESE
ncbi:MAG: hypothetical protein IKL74_04205 [Clostridia bacterium]|nr:hypothetical protein [Clostridia bacterium]